MKTKQKINKRSYLYIFIFIYLLNPFLVIAQDNIEGIVLDNTGEPLINATVNWIETKTGAITNIDGKFSISQDGVLNKQLIIRYIGFSADTVTVNDPNESLTIILGGNNELNSVQLTENKQNAYIDADNPIKVEVITQKELTKAACCDLTGCFETQISVEPKTTNLVTQTKELSVLGMSGVYNHILLDGMPLITGANYTYGVSAIPGTLIKNITISQGQTSVIQGPESLTSQINILLKEKQEERIFLNLYINSFLSKQVNLDYNFNLGKWKIISSLHSTQPGSKVDKNDDNFLDIPQTTKYSFYNKWTFGEEFNSDFYTSATFRYINEKRIGGQVDFEEDEHQGGNVVYGQTIEYTQPEFMFKTKYKINNNNRLKLTSSISTHEQTSFFGTTKYEVDQLNYHIDLTHTLNWQTHTLNSGISYKHLDLKQEVEFLENNTNSYDGEYKNYEHIAGLFVENMFSWKNNLDLITGLRIDHLNNHGIYLTPRAQLKYNYSEHTTFRINIGKGWRTSKLFSEQPHLFSTNLDLIIDNNLKPEEAINIGFNGVHNLFLDNFDFEFVFDIYHTNFKNQIYGYRNINNSETTTVIENMDNSASNSIQAQITVEILDEFAIKFGYNYLDVFREDENGEKIQLPHTAKHHIISTFSYQPLARDWQFDINIHGFGKKKLYEAPVIYQHDDHTHHYQAFSDPYIVMNSQFTKYLDNIDIYIGCENIFNYLADYLIISADDPFGPYFDSHNSWGPTKSREFYLGLRAKF